ncbi:apolipoprotein N-acyltransferase [Neorickettsia helminthoeca str. Oregon]|uniref:Apolipoprotein N-acyltransferase n=2 Tax=Neorickettsia helminthoeca TaxID=33994 RepID=X5H3Z5_9RICK|nr:apolipoprotein N-acyltransferase [Neorickettsia helminthoeca str. Oregon]
MTLGFAPFHMTFLLVLSIALTYKKLKSTLSAREVLSFSLWFGSSFFLISLYWISFSLATDMEHFWWLIIPTPIALSIFLSLYFVLAFGIFKFIKYQNPITFTFIITLSEYLREICFSGFPWNLIGYTWNCLGVLQFASIFGIFGLTALTTFVSASLGELLFEDSKVARTYILCSVSLLVCVFSFGLIRLHNNPIRNSQKIVRIVQANIPHQQRWSTDYSRTVLQKYVEMSKAKDFQSIDYFIWPESSVPFLLHTRKSDITKYISANLGKIVIAGGTRIENNNIYNSIFLIKDGQVEDYYDKIKLVPLGEYVPLGNILPINKIVNGASNFTHGKKRRKILEGINAAPTICYESIFTSSLHGNCTADWNINLVNDSWFGNSTALYQHLQMARMRAIEYGLPIIRSTTTGISAVIDPYGRILARIPYSSQGILDIPIPRKHSRRTFYTLLHNLFH